MNQEIFADDTIFYGGALNQNGASPENIAGRMIKKIEAGCSYFLTQPVYDEESIKPVSYTHLNYIMFLPVFRLHCYILRHQSEAI